MSGYDSALIGLEITEHTDVLELPDRVWRLYIESIVWSRAHGTDGYLSPAALRRMTGIADPDGAAQELVVAGRYQVDPRGGFAIVDYLDTQDSKAKVKKRRDGNTERQQAWRDRHSNALRNGPRNATYLPTDLPTDREGSKSSRRKGGATAAAAAPEARSAAPPSAPWWPPDDDSYSDFDPDLFRCSRCFGIWPWSIMTAPRDDSEDLVCQSCLSAWRGDDCPAFTQDKPDKPAHRCGQRPSKDERWCRYHQRQESRGAAPEADRPRIERRNARLKAKADAKRQTGPSEAELIEAIKTGPDLSTRRGVADAYQDRFGELPEGWDPVTGRIGQARAERVEADKPKALPPLEPMPTKDPAAQLLSAFNGAPPERQSLLANKYRTLTGDYPAGYVPQDGAA